jgi:hypothetical protein
VAGGEGSCDVKGGSPSGTSRYPESAEVAISRAVFGGGGGESTVAGGAM